MTRFVAQRIGEAVMLFLALSAIIFTLGTVVPGDVALTLTGQSGSTPERLAQLRHQLGLTRPLPERYWDWLSHAVRGDFGTSLISGRSIGADIAQQFAVTFELAIFALLLALVIGLPVGVFASTRPNSIRDKLLRGSTLVFFAVPTFVSGVLLVLVGSRYLHPLYSSFYVGVSQNLGENLRSLLLPALAVALPMSAMVAQMTRATMLDALHEPFVVTARAKGVPERRINYLHGLRAALAPVVTLTGLEFGSLIGGLIIVEQIFNLPGLGRGVLTAILGRDYQFVVAGVLVIAGVYVAVNLLVDVLYPILDPRQRSG